MGNVCSIFHKRFDKLYHLTQNYQKAVFLDKCIYWWQISKYKLNDNKIYFTRPYSQLAQEANISVSSVNRYLSELEKKGYIEKRTKLSSSKKEEYKVKKRTYIRICDKLLTLLDKNFNQEQSNTAPTSSFSDHNDTIDNVNLIESIYKVKDNNSVINNIVNEKDDVNYVENHNNKFQKTTFAIEKEIGERVTDELKDKVKGMMYNLEHKEHVKLFDKERLFAEIIFSLTHEQQFKGVICTAFKINIIAKKLRERAWKTPIGFYKHWDVGQNFHFRDEAREKRTQEEKLKHELVGVTDPIQIARIKARFVESSAEKARYRHNQEINEQTNNPNSLEIKKLKDELKSLNLEIESEGRLLSESELNMRLGKGGVTEALITGCRNKLFKLYDRQAEVEQRVSELSPIFGQCA